MEIPLEEIEYEIVGSITIAASYLSVFLNNPAFTDKIPVLDNLDRSFRKDQKEMFNTVKGYIEKAMIDPYALGGAVFDSGSCFVGVGEVNAAVKGSKLAEGAKVFQVAEQSGKIVGKSEEVEALMNKLPGSMKNVVEKIKSIEISDLSLKPSLAGVGSVGERNALGGELFSVAKSETKGTGKVVTTDSRPDFVGKLKGEEVKLPNVKIEKVTFNKRNPNDTAQLRKDFNKVRKDLMKSMADNPEKIKELKKAGISDNDIEDMMEYGLVPDGWQVHHKIPLDQGGTNDVENLGLIKNHPYHKVITNEQNSLTKGMKPGDSKIVDFPIPEEGIYPPNKE